MKRQCGRAISLRLAQVATSQCSVAGSAPPVIDPARTSQAVGVDVRNSATTATVASTSSTARSTTPMWQASNSRLAARGAAPFAPCPGGEVRGGAGEVADKIGGLRMTDCRYIE